MKLVYWVPQEAQGWRLFGRRWNTCHSVTAFVRFTERLKPFVIDWHQARRLLNSAELDGLLKVTTRFCRDSALGCHIEN